MLNLARLALSKTSDVHLIDDRVAHGATDVAVSLPIEAVVDNDTFRRTNHSVGRVLETTCEGFGVRIDQACVAVEPLPGLGIEWTVGLEMVELTGLEPVQMNTPYIPPAILFAIEFDYLAWLAIFDASVQEQPHGSGRSTENSELHPPFRDGGTVGEAVSKLEIG